MTEGGRTIECDAVVVGAGVRPDTMLAERAGIEVDNGIVCDSRLETSVEGIYAAGDVCSYDSAVHGRRLRVEHWDVALQQGQYAAGAMLGDSEPYRVVPYFFSDLGDWAWLEYVGPHERYDELVWRGDRDAGKFSVWYLDGGKVAARSRRASEDLAQARRLIESGADVSAPERRAGGPGGDLEAVGACSPQRVWARRYLWIGYRKRPSLRAGVMATRLPLEQEFGVRVPGPQLRDCAISPVAWADRDPCALTRS